MGVNPQRALLGRFQEPQVAAKENDMAVITYVEVILVLSGIGMTLGLLLNYFAIKTAPLIIRTSAIAFVAIIIYAVIISLILWFF